MLLLNTTPEPTSDIFDNIYENIVRKGMVHSAMMQGQHYDIADNYIEAWAYPAVTWSWGGVETYQFSNKRTVSIQPTGVLTIAAHERYAYDASHDKPFRSNMIAFPQWMRDGAVAPDEISELSVSKSHLTTRLCHPSPETFSLMIKIANQCAHGFHSDTWYTEQVALLYAQLLQEQEQYHSGASPAIKKSTRQELARRIDRSEQFILEEYKNPNLSIDDIANAACLSRYHLIRTFKGFTGQTPMQFLTVVRMDAALRLLQYSSLPIEYIACAVGYCDRTAFARAFNRVHGLAPTVARSLAR